MGEYLSQIFTLVLSLIGGAGLTILLAPKLWKRKELAETKKSEHTADQEKVRTTDMSIDVTQKVMGVYTQAIEDMQSLHNKEKTLLMDTIKNQDEKITAITTQLSTLTEDYKLLKDSHDNVVKELLELKERYAKEPDCSNCEFYADCKRRLKLNK